MPPSADGAPAQTRRCPACGQENPAANPICSCGFDVDFDVPPSPAPAPSGVRGWLLFFCVQVTILASWRSVRSMGEMIAALARGAALDTPGGQFLFVFESLDMIVTLLGVVAGIALWRIRPGALRLVRVYLLAYAIVRCGMAACWSLLPVPDDVIPPTVKDQVLTALNALAYPALWWAYFDRSRRVRATYVLKPEAIQAFD